jgi:hypothetical protein
MANILGFGFMKECLRTTDQPFSGSREFPVNYCVLFAKVNKVIDPIFTRIRGLRFWITLIYRG